MILISIPVFFFLVLPVLFASPAVGALVWIADVVLLVWGLALRQKETSEESIRRRAQLQEEGRQRAQYQVRERAQLEEEGRLRARQEFGSPPSIVKETIVREREVLIQCRNCGVRYQQGTPRCLTCGANL